MRTRPTLAALAALTAILALCAGAGYWVGRATVLGPLRAACDAIDRGRSLAEVIPADQRDAVAGAYLEDEQAETALHHYSWSPPQVPAPFVGHVPAPGASHNAVINHFGCRDDRPIAVPKPRGRRRVFLTGGSTAYGSGAASQERTIGALLQAMLNDGDGPTTEVFTFANPGWASTHERVAIENRLSELQPDAVVSLSGANDARWAELGRNTLWLRGYGDEGFFAILNTVRAQLGRPPLPDAQGLEPPRPPPAVVAARLAKNARLAHLALSIAGAEYVFCLQPSLHVTGKRVSARERQYLSDPDTTRYAADCYAAFRTALGEIRDPAFEFLDLSGLFDGAGAEHEIFLDSCHFGSRGNRAIAAAIHDALRARWG